MNEWLDARIPASRLTSEKDGVRDYCGKSVAVPCFPCFRLFGAWPSVNLLSLFSLQASKFVRRQEKRVETRLLRKTVPSKSIPGDGIMPAS